MPCNSTLLRTAPQPLHSRRLLGVGLTAVLLTAVAPAVAASAYAQPLSSTTTSAPRTVTASVRPPVTFPGHPRGLPAPKHWGSKLDDPAGYQMQQACVAAPSRGIVKLRSLALRTYDRGGSSPATPRACTSGSTSEHKDGRAWDWMLNVHNRADKKVAANFLGWLVGPGPSGVHGEMARRLGVMYVIYNHEIWASYRGTWAAYDGPDPHTSHIHISLSWNGARAHTSFWTGHTWATDYGTCQVFRRQPAVSPTSRPRLTPCPPAVTAPRISHLPLAWMGSVGDGVRKGQRLLHQPVTGVFGASTRSAVVAYQANHDLPRTGALDKPTWASLVPSSRRLTAPDWTRHEAKQWSLANAGDTVLRRGSAGRAVYALQVVLGLPDTCRNGMLGRRTAAEVEAFKAAHGLALNTVVNEAFWQAL
jgi:peptidoglycan hydrolase-like protein with peptidoglycan-binding domain